MKILLVDDAKFIQYRIQTILENEGHEIVTADNGEEAIEKFKAESPDLTLLDVVMPEMSGLEVLGKLKDIDSKCIVLMLTNDIHKETILEAKEKHADGYIVKPVDKDALLEKISKVFE